MLEYKNKQQNYFTCLKTSSTTISLVLEEYNMFTKITLNKYTISSNISNYRCRQRQMPICLPQVFRALNILALCLMFGQNKCFANIYQVIFYDFPICIMQTCVISMYFNIVSCFVHTLLWRHFTMVNLTDKYISTIMTMATNWVKNC